MQLSKVLLVIGATSACLIPLAGHAADKAPVAPLVAPTPAAPDAVEKARAAMRQKMDELQGTAPAAAAQAPAKAAPAPSVPVAPVPPAPVPTPTPAPAPVAAVPAPSPVTIPTADPAAIAKAREALHQKMTELNSQPNQAAPAPKAAQPAVAAKKQKATEQAQAKAQATKATTNPAAQPKPSQVAAAKKQPKAVKASKKAPVPAPTIKPVVANAQGFEPLSGPPSPLSASQQQRLGELLSKYKADQVTPEQYHLERAKILAAP